MHELFTDFDAAQRKFCTTFPRGLFDRNRATPSAYYVGAYGFCELLAGHWDLGFSVLQEGIRLNPYHPSYFFITSFLHAYAHHNYQKAYEEALKFDLPGLFLCPLYQTAALGQLGRKEDAKATLDTLLHLRPDFPARAHESTGRLIKADGQVEHILEGLQKAGLRPERWIEKGGLVRVK